MHPPSTPTPTHMHIDTHIHSKHGTDVTPIFSGDVARQLCKGPATPAKVAKAAKRLACLDAVKAVLGGTPEQLVALGVPLHTARMELLHVRVQLTPLCGPLVAFQRWLSAPDAQVRWQGEEGSEARELLLLTIQVSLFGVVVLCVMHM